MNYMHKIQIQYLWGEECVSKLDIMTWARTDYEKNESVNEVTLFIIKY